MTKPALIFLLFLPAGTGFAQGSVQWRFEGALTGRHEAVLSITASLAPGWHLYSQFLEGDGPIPTRFVFETSDAFILLGKVEEKGTPFTFHDDTYNMDITWYSGTISFLQKIRLTKPAAVIKGRVEYMTCSSSVCIPGKQDFSIPVGPSK